MTTLTYNLRMPTLPRQSEPTAADLEQAKRFAEWQRTARNRKGWSIPDLSRACDYSDSQVRLYDADGYAGVDVTGRYRRPKAPYVEAVAHATGADRVSGLIAAGLMMPPPTDHPAPDVERIPEIEYIPRGDDDDVSVVVHAYEGMSTSDRARVRDYMRMIEQANKAASIGGRRSDEEENPSRAE